jgi:biotin transporter BioY
MMALGYIVSYYLNALADSSHRATVLSFKGVAFNLGYGFISLVFALALRAVRDGGSSQDAVARGFAFLPQWLLFGLVVCAIYFKRQHRFLSSIPRAVESDETPGLD